MEWRQGGMPRRVRQMGGHGGSISAAIQGTRSQSEENEDILGNEPSQ